MKNGTCENGCKKTASETILMTLPLTVGTHVEGNGTGTQRENAKMAATLKLLLAYTAVVTTEGRPVKLAEP